MKILKFISEIILFSFLFISVLFYLDALNENLKLNKGIIFFIDVLIICYILYRYELSFLETGMPQYKNPPKVPSKIWDNYVENEQKENLKMINETIPEIIKELEYKKALAKKRENDDKPESSINDEP